MTEYLSAAAQMGGNQVLYNIIEAALFLATLIFLLYIIIDYKKKDGDDERQRTVMFLGNRVKAKKIPWHLHPSKWYNSFIK
jgi:hypothetical protein